MTLLFTAPTFRPLTIAGAIMPGAYVQFYESGTTTPADVYADAGLTTPLSNPVEADSSSGEFPPIYLDRRVTYRAQLYNEADVLQWDVDPIGTALDQPPGTVVMFFGDETARDAAYPPAEWQVCDGTNGTPDLVGRFPRSMDSGLSPGDTGGNETGTTDPDGAHDHGGDTDPFTLTLAEVPEHTHNVRYAAGPGAVISRPNLLDAGVYGIGGAAYGSGSPSPGYLEDATGDGANLLEEVGDGDPHDHGIAAEGNHTHGFSALPPYCVLWFLMRLP